MTVSSSSEKFAVRLSGLPFRVSASELGDFLAGAGCNIPNPNDQVKILLDDSGRPSGNAFVILNSSDDVDNAVSLSGQNIPNHSRYAKIVGCDYNEIAWSNRKQPVVGQFHRIRLSNLPFRLTEYEIVKFFSDIKVADVELLTNQENRPVGEAIVYVKDAADVDTALTKDGQMLNDRDVKVTKDNDNLEDPIDRSGVFLTVGNLSFKATPAEIIAFFEPVVCWCVRIVCHSGSRASGYAIAEFATEEDVESAIQTKNGEMMCERRVNLTRDLPPSAGQQQGRGGGMSMPTRGRGGGSSFESAGRGGFDSGAPTSYGGRGGGNIPTRGGGGGRGGMNANGPMMSRGGGGRGGSMGGRGGGSSGSYDQSGFKVFMSGLVFSATESDISEWFARAGASPTSIKILVGDNGRASGNAVAWFGSRVDADKAMSLNREYLGSRFVNLRAEY